jgi:hypothetical protein
VVALPRTAPFKAQLDTLTIDEALAFLNSRIDEKRQSFSFLGQSYAAGVVGLLAPTLLLALLLQLVLHQRHLLHRASAEDIRAISVPWLGIFDDVASRITFELSVMALPVGSALLSLVLLTERWSPMFFYTAAVVSVVGWLSVIVLRDNRRLMVIIRSLGARLA